MPEWLPVIFGVCLGASFRPRKGSARIASHAIAIVLLASCAFVASGECYLSWTYLMVDLVQALLGFAAGVIAVPFISQRSNLSRRREAA
jgi:uncharacterized membrane protein AbrB (regulator of aidB expression)